MSTAAKRRKTCCRCGVPKLVHDYHRNSRKPDGLQEACIECRREMRAGAEARLTSVVVELAAESAANEHASPSENTKVQCTGERGCYDLSHRRPKTGCPQCGGAYAEAVIERQDPWRSHFNESRLPNVD